MTQDNLTQHPGNEHRENKGRENKGRENEDRELRIVDNPDWRQWDAGDCEAWLAEDTRVAAERYRKGREEYGPTFVGDPLNHLQDELRDSNFYAWQARRQRAALVRAMVQTNRENYALCDEIRMLRDAMAQAGIPAPPAGGGPAP